MFVVLGATACALLAITRSFPEFLAFWWMVGVGLALVHADLATHTLPNMLNLGAYLGTGTALSISSLAGDGPAALLRAVLGGLTLAAAFLALAHLTGQLGIGDAKLATTVGTALAWSSWSTLLTGTLAIFCLAAIPSAFTLRRPHPHAHIAFGPYLLAGTILALLVAP